MKTIALDTHDIDISEWVTVVPWDLRDALNHAAELAWAEDDDEEDNDDELDDDEETEETETKKDDSEAEIRKLRDENARRRVKTKSVAKERDDAIKERDELRAKLEGKDDDGQVEVLTKKVDELETTVGDLDGKLRDKTLENAVLKKASTLKFKNLDDALRYVSAEIDLSDLEDDEVDDEVATLLDKLAKERPYYLDDGKSGDDDDDGDDEEDDEERPPPSGRSSERRRKGKGLDRKSLEAKYPALRRG